MEHRDGYISPEVAINIIEEFGGKFPGFRRAHAKGIAFDALFTPNGNAKSYTTAAHLQTESVEAVVRFSHSTVSPDPPEMLIPIKGMAVRFSLPDGGFTNLTMANIPVFMTKTPEAFLRLLQVMTKGRLTMGERLRVLRKDPEFHTLPAILAELKPPASFATETYHALHSYYLVDGHGDRRAVRFRWVPIQADLTGKMASSKRYHNLEEELILRFKEGAVQFRLMIQFAEAGDPIDDPSVKWPEERTMIDAGILTLTAMRSDAAEDEKFDPAIEVDGFKCSDDPILLFRSPAYAESYGRRMHETDLSSQQETEIQKRPESR